MKKKKIGIALSLLLFFVLGTSGIYASSQESVNEIDTGVVNIEIEEFTLNEEGKEVAWVDNVNVTPGKTISKIPYFTATGNDCYIRATMEVNGLRDEISPITSDYFHGISEEWMKIGDYYYYKEPLKTNESVDFFHSFTVPSDWDDSVNPNNSEKWGFSIDVTVDAIQSDNFTPDFESESPWGDVEIKESIHKDGYDVNTFTTNSETEMFIVIEDKDDVVTVPKNFFQGFKTMLPGDTLTDSAEINSKKHCKLYMSTESIDDIDLLKKMNLKITLTKNEKENTIYDGPLDATLKKELLGEFKKGETGKLTFIVSMPSELGNEYTLRNGSVKWTFETESINELIEKPNENPEDKKEDVKTMDEAPVIALISLVIVSGLVVVVIVIRKRKDEE